MFRRFTALLQSAFAPPEFVAVHHERLAIIGARARLATGLFALVAVPLLPASTGARMTVAALIVGVYMPHAFIAARIAQHSPTATARVFGMVGDILMCFTFALVVDDLRLVAMFGYLVIVAFATLVGGFGAGLFVTAFVAPLTIIAELAAAPDERISPFVGFMFIAVLGILAAVIEGATRERRRLARSLTRLQRAIDGVAPEPDLDATLHSVGEAAKDAIGALFVSVFLREGDNLVRRARAGELPPDGVSKGDKVVQRILGNPGASPTGIALTQNIPVVVQNVFKEERFAQWRPLARERGFTSTISVPLRADGDAIGVLSAYLPTPELATEENLDLLMGYAHHASVTVRRAVAYERERALSAQLAAMDVARSEFVSTVSHELRTPLTVVKGFIETLLRHSERFDEAERQHLLERALSNADELGRLIDQILDDARLESGIVNVTTRPTHLVKEMGRFVEAHPYLSTRHRVVVDVPFDLWVNSDREALEHVLLNLVGNAAKYSPEGTTITISAHPTTPGPDPVVEVSVSDEGPGIAEDEADKVFERFYRSKRSGNSRGTGVGLAIVRRYVELLGGRVWVEPPVSPDGAPTGATFTFTLPACAPKGATTVTLAEEAEPASAPSAAR